MNRGFRLTAQRNVACQVIDIYAAYLPANKDGHVVAYEGRGNHVVVPQFVEPGETFQPFTQLTEDRAQELMDSLWSAGLRPTEGKASAGLGAAQEDRIKHLTSLVEKLLPSALRAPEPITEDVIYQHRADGT